MIRYGGDHDFDDDEADDDDDESQLLQMANVGLMASSHRRQGQAALGFCAKGFKALRAYISLNCIVTFETLLACSTVFRCVSHLWYRFSDYSVIS